MRILSGEVPAQGTRTRQEHQMTNRRTSDYSLRVTVPPDITPDDGLQLLHRAAEHLELPLTDQHTDPGVAAIGFRSADDETAQRTAATVITALGTLHWVSWELTTGYGVHKRSIQHTYIEWSRPDGSYHASCSCGAAVIVFTGGTDGPTWHREHVAGRIPGQEPVTVP